MENLRAPGGWKWKQCRTDRIRGMTGVTGSTSVPRHFGSPNSDPRGILLPINGLLSYSIAVNQGYPVNTLSTERNNQKYVAI